MIAWSLYIKFVWTKTAGEENKCPEASLIRDMYASSSSILSNKTQHAMLMKMGHEIIHLSNGLELQMYCKTCDELDGTVTTHHSMFPHTIYDTRTHEYEWMTQVSWIVF